METLRGVVDERPNVFLVDRAWTATRSTRCTRRATASCPCTARRGSASRSPRPWARQAGRDDAMVRERRLYLAQERGLHRLSAGAARTRLWPYMAGQQWADPDIEQASWWMKTLREDPARGRELGTAARATVMADLSPAVVGRQIKEWLARSACIGRPGDAPPPPRSRHEARRAGASLEARSLRFHRARRGAGAGLHPDERRSTSASVRLSQLTRAAPRQAVGRSAASLRVARVRVGRARRCRRAGALSRRERCAAPGAGLHLAGHRDALPLPARSEHSARSGPVTSVSGASRAAASIGSPSSPTSRGGSESRQPSSR